MSFEARKFVMIIGVDAGALSIADDRLKVGVWRVNVNLLRELAKLDRENTYRFYSFRPIERGIVDAFGGRATNVVLPERGFLKAWMPLKLRLRPVDWFLGLSQALPSFAKYSIGFVYDVGFLHTPDNYPNSYKKLAAQTKDLVRRAKHIVTISQSVSNDLISIYGVNSKSMCVAYPGVAEVFRKKVPSFRAKNPYFLFVGALKRGKNIPTLLEAFAKFTSTSKVLYDLYLVGGNYWFDPAIDETIDRLSLRSSVKLLGVVSDTQLASLYRGATALVMPSLWEGFCLPVVEAMASGCPVIAATSGALPEIVGNAGIFIDSMDSDGITQALQQLATDEAKRKELIVKGKTRARLFSWSAMAKVVLCDIWQ